MIAVEYIKNGLEKLANHFPQVEIRYSFNYEINTHIIQFDPIDAYYKMPELDAAWIPLSLEFDTIFEDESIAFIGSDSILSISGSYELSWNIQVTDLTFSFFKELLAEADFGGFINTFPATVYWDDSLLNNSGYEISPADLKVSVNSISHSFFENSIFTPTVVVQDRKREITKDEKYAMAA